MGDGLQLSINVTYPPLSINKCHFPSLRWILSEKARKKDMRFCKYLRNMLMTDFKPKCLELVTYSEIPVINMVLLLNALVMQIFSLVYEEKKI